MITPKTIRLATGEELPTEICPDGTWICPWCRAPARASELTCPNPGCDAAPHLTPATLQARRLARLEAAEAAAERDRIRHLQLESLGRRSSSRPRKPK